MRFSLITVSFNAIATIENTIKSVLSQDFESFEYIVVDGASTDGTISILDKYMLNSHFKYVSEKDSGIYDAMNKGLSIASGEYVLFLGADDLLTSTHILSEVSKKLTDSDVVYYGDVLLSKELKIYDGEFNKWKWGYKNICHQSIFYPKNVYKKYSYDVNYRLVSDWVYNLTLVKNNVLFNYIGVVVSLYNTEGLSSINEDSLFIANRRKMITDAVGYLPYLYGIFIRLLRKLHIV